MKYLTLLILILSSVVHAADSCEENLSAVEAIEKMEIDTKVPSNLKGATIIVKTPDGKESVVPAEQFKVVPRKQQFIVTKTLQTKTVNCPEDKVEVRKNRLSLIAGRGAQAGLNTDNGPYVVESKVGLVFGLQYQRLITDRFSLGIQGQTNKTGSLLLGVDF